ncbi:DUF4307 domain-containing protein [Auraticoccus monumenti]|uniref:DUF4307 domain-containing protein n=1 Tax=Auraticoccus monumenti TaxID=675864 RepID=A0A1G6ZTP8_9ACTN|nr:DUF4307 domain-containing protein [Auraticoccus monumenti]SDE05215.1 protein of unknown function [Auraticoccus monumenti]
MPEPVPTSASTDGPDPAAARSAAHARPGPTTDADAERIRRRYPRSRLSTPPALVALALAAVVALAWLVWTAVDQSVPPVSARVDRYVISEQQVDVTVSIQRADPSTAVSCLLIAQALNFERVGEVEVELGPGGEALVQQLVPVRTFRTAAAVSFDGCEVL